MEAALLQQKVEFLEMEIEEVRRREENLKKINNSLMQALNNEPLLNDQSLSSFQKNEGNSAESSLKKKHKEEVALLERQIQELFLSKKELQIDLKHQKTSQESEKYEYLSMIKQLETEKMQLEKALRKIEENSDLILQDRNFKENQRTGADNKSLNDSRFILKENEQLKSKTEYLSAKLKSKKEKIKRLKERTNERALRVRMEEMEEELETYKVICKSQNSSTRNCDVEKTLRKELEDAQSTIASLRNKNDPKPLIMKKDLEIQQLKEKLLKCLADDERLSGELGKANLKLQQNEIYWKMADQKRSETELALKNEIKFLIGKLLKAKSKLGTDDSKEVSSKRVLVTTVRSQSVKKDLKVNKGVSPLDLSSITRSDSPFCVSNIDI